MPTSTSLTLRALFKTAANRAGLGNPAGHLSGLTPAAKALHVATSALHDLVVVIVPTDREVEQTTLDVRFFLGSVDGLSTTEAERAVLPFPSHEIDPYRGLAVHFDVASARARALHALTAGSARVLVASAAALFPRLSAPDRLAAASADLQPGGEIGPVALAGRLADAGFAREDPVDEHGEYCVRGGLVDFFPAGDEQPIRVEFLGDSIESIRRYDPATQRSVATLDRASVIPLRELFETGQEGLVNESVADRSATIFDYLTRSGRHLVLLSEPDGIWTQARRLEDALQESYRDATARGDRLLEPGALVLPLESLEHRLQAAARLSELALETADDAGASEHVACQPTVGFSGRFGDWVADVRRAFDRADAVVLIAATRGRAERIVELAADYDLPARLVDGDEDGRPGALLVATGELSRGFYLQSGGLQLYVETDVFDEERRSHERRRSVARAFLSDFRDLKVGDPVVHVDHGIGIFDGLKQIVVGHDVHEFVELRYAGRDKLYVPVEGLEGIQKYTGASKPSLDRLGGMTWERAKTRVRRAMRDMAEDLLKLYAARQTVQGYAFSPDIHWQQEFEEAFEYELTPDQRSAIADIKHDMEALFPMDRLLCGDVGYGKTEVALRAAFKSVMDGKQVALLAPTTVLAFQHLKTIRERFAGFPIRAELISRFRSRAEQKQVLADLGEGKVDIIIGTHRLLSKDAQFRDLGLLIVDEEQRFGVAHKERIKQLRRRVDVLTLTATPIPRTLNMSLVGIRDMSIIETAPKDRQSIQTHVVRFDPRVVAQAIRTELARGGQIYYVHNRIESIYAIGDMVTRLVPEARVAIAHGQMIERTLERTMIDFVAHTYDLLLATTIIENGLDIPNANTLIVDRADDYGLAQLYQLRGRVGRSERRAYAYLLVPPEDTLSPVARKRLAAIREFSDLGSGFRVAALDLEIRGAGNLLGGEQSGHIEAIGFDLYMKLLEQTVRELKGEELEDEVRATVNLKVDLRIDEDFISDMNQRLNIYRRVASARSEAELDQALDEVHDRYGRPPASVRNLGEYGRIRILADRLGVESLEREGHVLAIKFRWPARFDPSRLVGMVQRRTDMTLVPPSALRVDLAGTAGPRSVTGPGAGRSWWTSGALAGEVAPGFSKAAVLQPARDDARVLAQTLDLLGELSQGVGIS